MAIPSTDILILFTNCDIITYFLNLASCSKHFISIKHRILATFNINKKNQFELLYAFKYILYQVIVGEPLLNLIHSLCRLMRGGERSILAIIQNAL